MLKTRYNGEIDKIFINTHIFTEFLSNFAAIFENQLK